MALMFIVVGVWISPVALGALAFGVGLGLRAPWWALLVVVAVAAAAGALAVTAALRIARGAERRGRLATVSWPVQQQIRAEALTRDAPAVFPAAGAPAAIEQHVHYHYHAADSQQAAARRAIAEGERHAR